MASTIGALVTEHIAVSLIENNQIVGPVRRFPEAGNLSDALEGMPAEEIVESIAREIESVAQGQSIEAIGVGFPGISRNGLIEESPNLKQTKGLRFTELLTASLMRKQITAPVHLLNDAAALAAGIAATRGELDRLLRVWFLGVGIGLGRYPQASSFIEAGHFVVTLDAKENLCGCGGIGHLEGLIGHRAMRLRFLDLEPEEVFAEAAVGDRRCRDFVKLWHRALAAATATNIHIDGPGKFYISGPNAKFVQLGLLDQYLREMVQMSPLQGSTFEAVPTSDETALIGAALSGEHAIGKS
ncbi:MAG TPA: ROK family protein [Pyrinomonadaceae bacterium]|nr:ROK family protein [Pyrinomonadaceae bacterium]